jgi:hypothetical protein
VFGGHFGAKGLICACFEWRADLLPVWAWREGSIGESVDVI